MIFSIKSTAFSVSERTFNELDLILSRVEDDIHEMDIEDADLLEDSDWYQSSRPSRKQLLEKIAGNAVWRSPRTKGPHLRRVEVVDEESSIRARHTALTPLRVLVENAVSDGCLLKAALRTFANEATYRLCFGEPSEGEPPAFKIESRGGHGELKKMIVQSISEANERARVPRLIVITDSDGEWPGDVKAHAQEIRTLCTDAGLPCPPLNKRTAENYIPDDILLAWGNSDGLNAVKPAIDALLRLSPEQRDYVHINSGNKEPWDHSKENVAELFSSVSLDDRNLLKVASLKGRGDNMMIMALEVHGAELSSQNFQDRDQNGDLLALVRQIEDEL